MLKPLNSITEPDFRHSFSGAGDPDNPFRWMELEDFHALVSSLELPEYVSPEIREMFERGLHVFLYSWFEYEITPLAVQHGWATLEAALKDRYGNRARGMHNLALLAVADGLFETTVNGHPTPKMLASERNTWAHGHNGYGSPTITHHALATARRFILKLYLP